MMQTSRKIIDRWEVLEIEKQKAILSIPNFNNPAEAARAWADQYENNQVLARNNAQKICY